MSLISPLIRPSLQQLHVHLYGATLTAIITASESLQVYDYGDP